MKKSSNPFLPFSGKMKPPKRNCVDLSRQSLFTTSWGKLYPFFLQEVLPGDSFEIDCSVGFRSMQTLFPLQSRVRMSASFYLVRNRTIWPHWEDFIFKSKPYVHPYLDIRTTEHADKLLKTGSLGDALGIPTTSGRDGNFSASITSSPILSLPKTTTTNTKFSVIVSQITQYKLLNQEVPFVVYSSTPNVTSTSINTAYGIFYRFPIEYSFSSLVKLEIPTSSSVSAVPFALYLSNGFIPVTDPIVITPTVDSHGSLIFDLSSFNLDSYEGLYLNVGYAPNSTATTSFDTGAFFQYSDFPVLLTGHLSSIDEPIYSKNPFGQVGRTGDLVPINALPFRAYEFVCNYYYRNDLNSPFMINGEPQYNKFITNDGDGADDTPYDFHFHNWELDRFVSSLPTPQFGAAPLVGLTYHLGVDEQGNVRDTAEFTFQDSEANEFKATLGVDNDGKIVDIANFSPDIPSSNLRQLQEMVNYGFSINTLRDVNSFQRFLENSMRRGLRYRNQLKSHFGVNVDFPDIDVPQYIGGFSAWAESGQVTNMAETPETGLGDYVGTLSGFSKSSHKIRCYCPEHGFIIGIYSIYPTPIYSQSIDKLLLKTNPFDYYQTEFSKIGFVPIHYSEISPLQTDSDHSLSDVFGYQKAWYDYLSSYDTVHGDFRTTLRDFVVQRLWSEPPVLSEDFVRVNPEQINDIFTTRNIADIYGSNAKFLCSAVTNVTALRPIPVHGIPSIE